MRHALGGYFWDVLLLSEYNEHWENFYNSMCKVLPCNKCQVGTEKFHKEEELGKFPPMKNQQEKNEHLWKLRLARGGVSWREKVEKDGYTLNSWLEYLRVGELPFTQIKEHQEDGCGSGSGSGSGSGWDEGCCS